MPSSPFLATTNLPINYVLVDSGDVATATSEWIPASVAMNTNIWVAMTSSGTPTLTVTADVTVFDVVNGVVGTAITGIANNYRTISIGTTTTKDAWVHIDSPAEMDYPFKFIRYKLTINASTARVSCATCQNGL